MLDSTQTALNEELKELMMDELMTNEHELSVNENAHMAEFIDARMFAVMKGISERQLSYRLYLKQVRPHPIPYGSKYRFDPDAQIIIPPPKRCGGRPKGTTKEVMEARDGKKDRKRVNRRANKARRKRQSSRLYIEDGAVK